MTRLVLKVLPVAHAIAVAAERGPRALIIEPPKERRMEQGSSTIEYRELLREPSYVWEILDRADDSYMEQVFLEATGTGRYRIQRLLNSAAARARRDRRRRGHALTGVDHPDPAECHRAVEMEGRTVPQKWKAEK